VRPFKREKINRYYYTYKTYGTSGDAEYVGRGTYDGVIRDIDKFELEVLEEHNLPQDTVIVVSIFKL
jgi:hypothetical protein